MTKLDPERQNQAKQYARKKRILWVVNRVFSLTYALLWLLTGWSVELRAYLINLFGNNWLIVIAFAVIFSGVFYLINLPLSYYAGFMLPHHYDLSTQSRKDWILDQIKGLGLGAILGLPLIGLFYYALRVTGDAWWLWVTAGLLVFNVILGNLAPVLIMPIFNKFTPLSEDHADLEERLLELAEKAGTNVKGVYKMDMSRRTKQANAALTGIGNTRRIILGDTLINEFSVDEIETILAHELGHHVHKDIAWLIGFGTLITALGLYLVSLTMNWAIDAFGLMSVADPAGLPALMVLFSLFNLITMPLENAFSRWRENLADDYALEATKKTEAFASAFTRLANQNLSEVDPDPWVVFIFYSHPPLRERIAKAENWTE